MINEWIEILEPFCRPLQDTKNAFRRFELTSYIELSLVGGHTVKVFKNGDLEFGPLFLVAVNHVANGSKTLTIIPYESIACILIK